ncbi:MAG: hypothetical protein HRT77_11340, partial [Halioglobus sp.]|nr:hypothetical protein [Halioglobus sp.]
MQQPSVQHALGLGTPEPRHRDLITTWVVCFGALVLAFPIYSYLVFSEGMDRALIANALATQVSICYWLGMGAAFLPLPSLKNWSTLRRIHTVALTFMFVSYLTHLSWELGWLLLHEQIAESRNELW